MEPALCTGNKCARSSATTVNSRGAAKHIAGLACAHVAMPVLHLRVGSGACKDGSEHVAMPEMAEVTRNGIVYVSPECSAGMRSRQGGVAALRRFVGGGGGGNLEDAKELLHAICLSLLGDEAEVSALLRQDWVPGWEGWNELCVDPMDEKAFELAERFLRVAKANVPIAVKSNRDRLIELAQEGLCWTPAHPHGANNCLIDALLLGLMNQRLAPQSLTRQQRGKYCADCREHLRKQYGTPLGVYLDAHEQTCRILEYFLGKVWLQDVCVRVHLYDPLDRKDLGLHAHELEIIEYDKGRRRISDRVHLHVYNHVHADGTGYHFDALCTSAEDSRARQAESRWKPQASCPPNPSAKKRKTEETPSKEQRTRWEGTDEESLEKRQSERCFGPSNTEGPGLQSGSARAGKGGAQRAEPRSQTRKRGVMREEGQDKDIQTRPSKRLRGKTKVGMDGEAVPVAAQKVQHHAKKEESIGEPDLADMFVLRCAKQEDTENPRRKDEWRAQVVSEQLTAQPTLPWFCQGMASEKHAFDLPSVHCSVIGCEYACDLEEDLFAHVVSCHGKTFSKLCGADLGWQDVVRLYLAAVTAKCQSAAPVASVSIDRRALRNYQKSLEGDGIECLLCFVCARKYPYIKAHRNQDIGWARPVHQAKQTIFGLSLADAEKCLGMATFKEKYVNTATAFAQEEMRRELQDWVSVVRFPGHDLELLCCPEDKVCAKRCRPENMCSDCVVPLCKTCRVEIVGRGQQPPAALSNDMMVYYAPRDIFTLEVTVMEMLCASPCLTTMICFSLEQKLRGDRALDQDAWMNRQRMAMRGNATTFPLAWEDLLQQLQDLERDELPKLKPVNLPHCGETLCEFVSVIVKSGKDANTVDVKKIIHQARVRRAVVVALIEEAIKRGHPAFQRVNVEAMYSKANALPEDGIPEELVAILPYDDDLNRIMRQKAATPVRQEMGADELAREMKSMTKPNAVVGERTSNGMIDVNAQHVSSLQATVARSQGVEREKDAEFVLLTGNKLLDQFRPEYFGVAFPYVFKFCTAMPDPAAWSPLPRYRRGATAPRVELQDWVQIMARRCEAQISRDWTFGFAAWNLQFRSALNLSRNISLFNAPVFDERTETWRKLEAKDIEEGALQLLGALQGTYIAQSGKPKPVKGDVSKLPYVRGLGPAARKLAQNMRHTAQSMPGTQEARKRMRFEIEALRIRFGTPIFVTFSPDEAHQMLYIRMCRARRSDPVGSASVFQSWDVSERSYPPLDGNCTLPIHVETFCRALPTWEQRRQALARDPLASVDGFRVLVLLVLEHLFGVHVCSACPDCNLAMSSQSPCQNEDGSSAKLVGGVFGRMDAAYVTIEAQKSTGSLHAHCQCFVQCLHQHTALEEIFSMDENALTRLRRGYLSYSKHVMHGIYAGRTQEDVAARIAEVEGTWPEHKVASIMTQSPAYQRRRFEASAMNANAEAEKWAKDYLEMDVAELQFFKQHHYHPMNSETGERVPLHGCLRADKEGVCKSDFPRHAWVTEQGHVLCPCKAAKHGMATQGRKNRLGALHGPYGNEWLNCAHPAMLAALRGANVDVQLPYRLPFSCEACGPSPSKKQQREVLRAVQRAQDAQTGYCADYCAKNQPMAFHEIKEFQKGHQYLHSKCQQESVEKVGKRHVTRFLSDAYCKGIVRGQVECCNLRAYSKATSVVAAERISTAAFCSFPGRSFVQAVNVACNEPEEWGAGKKYMWSRKGTRGQRHIHEIDAAQAYGHRPRDARVWHLSPYEFTMYWDCIPMTMPFSRAEWQQHPKDHWDVVVTTQGEAKLAAARTDAGVVRLVPGVDVRRRDTKANERQIFFDSAAGRALQHGWYLCRRVRPLAPHFANSPVPSKWAEEPERNAKLLVTYFRAWTKNKAQGDADVVYVATLRQEGKSWEESLRAWLLSLPCEETKRYVGNFLSVYRVRPENEAENSDDEEDADKLTVTVSDLGQAYETQLSATGKKEANSKWVCHRNLSAEAMQQADKFWAKTQSKAAEMPNPWSAYDSTAMIRNAKRKLRTQRLDVENEIYSPEVRKNVIDVSAMKQQIQKWALEAASNKCNAKQGEFCKKVAWQVQTELCAQGAAAEPLRWALHGGPGTGKSYALNLIRKELFEDILGWKQGEEFQVVTLQAVMASDLEGDTIHHAFGLNWQGLGDERISGHKLLDLSVKALRWRWLILDEISMVSAELLARLELRCRELIRDLGQSKYEKDTAYARPFGGLNVVLAGDLWQLPPPRGTFLGEVPWEWLTNSRSKKVAHTMHGQELVWGSAGQGIQGLTELIECERTRDRWLQTLQQEIRNGALSQTNHAFLHGWPTAVPGSWNGPGDLGCKNPDCNKLMTSRCPAAKIQQLECHTCRRERESKARVMDPSMAPADKISDAKAIFPTNAIKYHVNKVRAKAWAAEHGQQLRHAIAQDKISSAALREKPDLGKDKLTWLQRHDQDCGALYGVLPLCVGMPVAATDHLDRERGILRGCPGEVVGWAWQAGETVGADQAESSIWNELPGCILVRFHTKATWRVAGVPEDNVYPVAPQRKPWYLDKGRRRPILRVMRKQFPLAPGFATTAHAAQGQTYKEGVVMDMCIGDAGDPLTAYIALTRIQDRESLYVYRAFPPEPFQKGAKLGRELLLRHWGGEKMDWQALRAQYREERMCKECHESKPLSAFTAGRWKRTDAAQVCKECVRRHTENGQPWQCMACSSWKEENAFEAKHAKPQATFYRICKTCEETRVCAKCQEWKNETCFSAHAWKRARGGARLCLDCTTKARGLWVCKICCKKQTCAAFQTWLSRHKALNGDQWCDSCKAKTIKPSVRKKAIARLAPRRKKLQQARREKVIEEVWKEILQQNRLGQGHAVQTDVQEEVSLERPGTQDVEVTRPARKLFKYTCPFCFKEVPSNVKTGDVDHRRTCGHRFSVQDGRIRETFEYKCPFCHGTVTSKIVTGQLDHRRTCGNRFYVIDGLVSRQTRQYAHVCPVCTTAVYSSKEHGRIQVRHMTPQGKACVQKGWNVKRQENVRK